MPEDETSTSLIHRLGLEGLKHFDAVGHPYAKKPGYKEERP